MTFKEWIERYATDDTKNGELARLVISDEGFPLVRSKVLLESHLYNLYEDEELIRIFRRVWKIHLEHERNTEIV